MTDPDNKTQDQKIKPAWECPKLILLDFKYTSTGSLLAPEEDSPTYTGTQEGS
jgi:hypothetical protein